MNIGFGKEFWKKFDFGVEELILLGIITLNLFDGFGLLNPFWDYIKKIVSWTAIGYLFYKIDICKIFTGISNKKINLLLIFGFFSLTIKNLILYSYNVLSSLNSGEGEFLVPLFEAIVNNSNNINTNSIILGTLLILMASFYFSVSLSVKKPSVLSLFYKTYSKPKNFKEALPRFLSFFLISFIFYIGIFNLFMEWLAIAIDAPILITGLAIYFIFILKHKEKFNKNSFLSDFGNFGNNVYNKLINHLKYKNSLIMIIAGMLILHMITDIFNFLWPYLFNLNQNYYFSSFDSYHMSFIELFKLNIVNMNTFQKISLGIIYLFNISGIIFLLMYPAYIWIKIYKREQINLNKWITSLSITSLFFFSVLPLFKIKLLFQNQIFGVDIQTQLIKIGSNFIYLFFTPLIIGVLVYYFYDSFKTWFFGFISICSQIFFLYYIGLYFYAILKQLFVLISLTLELKMYFLLGFYSILTSSYIIFYIVGLFGFEYNIYKKSKEKKKKRAR